MKSKVTNSFICQRPPGEWLIKENPSGDGSFFLRLDGYAIVPLEMYEDAQTLKNVRQCAVDWADKRKAKK